MMLSFWDVLYIVVNYNGYLHLGEIIRNIIIILLLSLTIPSWGQDCPDLFSENNLDILTWNIQNFPKHESTVNRVSHCIRQMKPDIIALQEIQSEYDFNQLIVELNSQESEYSWDGFRANSAAYDLNLAYIYNENVYIYHYIFDCLYLLQIEKHHNKFYGFVFDYN